MSQRSGRNTTAIHRTRHQSPVQMIEIWIKMKACMPVHSKDLIQKIFSSHLFQAWNFSAQWHTCRTAPAFGQPVPPRKDPPCSGSWYTVSSIQCNNSIHLSQYFISFWPFFLATSFCLGRWQSLCLEVHPKRHRESSSML